MNSQAETTWTVKEAKSRLSEVLRRARKQGPQYIGKLEPCVVIARSDLEAHLKPKPSLSTWLLRHAPKTNLKLPRRGAGKARPVPFSENQP